VTYAARSLHDNRIDAGSPAARTMLGLLRYVDGGPRRRCHYAAMSWEMGHGRRAPFYRVDHSLGLDPLNDVLVARFANSVC
jgi:hypothetical protein